MKLILKYKNMSDYNNDFDLFITTGNWHVEPDGKNMTLVVSNAEVDMTLDVTKNMFDDKGETSPDCAYEVLCFPKSAFKRKT